MPRQQRTIAREAIVKGIGLFHGADVTLRFRPAEENHGIAFERTDVARGEIVPALIDFVVAEPRRTAIAHQGVRVETIEHVMAALAGLQIDNCLVQLDGPEPPVGDGSAQHFADALLEAGIVEQASQRTQLRIVNKAYVFSLDRREELTAAPFQANVLRMRYELDYGHPHLAPQAATVDITPQSFLDAVAFARTFIMQEEVEALRAQGFGRRITPQNLLVIGPGGPLDNRLHTSDECARHKLLDCIGDLALVGCDLCGDILARRSGHRHNRELVRDLLIAHPHVRAAIQRQNRAAEAHTSCDPPLRMVS